MTHMIKTLSKSIREFKKPAILTPLLVTVEVILECIIPFTIAGLVNQMQAGCGMDVIVRYGVQLLIMAVLSLVFGVGAGNSCAAASTGFARNLRKDMFYRIQDYSFENIDKFSVSSLVTRMTTDVVNVQMSFMMIIRVAVRGPLMMIFSFIMGFAMGGRLAMIFLVTIPFLGICLALIIRKATPIFRRVFRKYDALNDSVQENVKAMRVVKSYVREEYEKKKFSAAAENVCKDFTKVERIMAFNNPVMQFCVYAGMAFVLSFGSYAVISSQGDVYKRQLYIAAAFYFKRSYYFKRAVSEQMIFLVCKRLTRGYNYRISRMYSHRIYIFHIAYGNSCIVSVAHHFVFYFFIAFYAFFDKRLLYGRKIKSVLHYFF